MSGILFMCLLALVMILVFVKTSDKKPVLTDKTKTRVSSNPKSESTNNSPGRPLAAQNQQNPAQSVNNKNTA